MSGKCEKILVVDDEPAIVRFLRTNLQARDFQTLGAMNGLEALEVIERERPDLIIALRQKELEAKLDNL